MLGQNSFDLVVGLIARLLPFPAGNRAFELVGHSVNDFGREREGIAVELTGFKELIQESALVAVGVSEAGNEAGHVASVFHRELYEFAFLEKAVHPRVLGTGPLGRLWVGGLRC